MRVAATVRVTRGHYIHNAVERFLDTPRGTLAMVAEQTLEGTLRAVVTLLTTSRLQEDALYVLYVVREEAEPAFLKLGLEIDTLEVRCTVLRGEVA